MKELSFKEFNIESKVMHSTKLVFRSSYLTPQSVRITTVLSYHLEKVYECSENWETVLSF